MADLSVKYAGMTLKNPLICASGPPTDTVEGCRAAAKAGFAAVVLKSILHRGVGPLRYQHAVPRFKVVDRFHPYERWTPKKGIDNMGLVAAGESGSVWTEEEYGPFINEVKRAVGEVKVGASAWGSARDPKSWEEYFDIFKDSDADFVELDMSYNRYFRRLDDLPKIVKKAKEKLSIPLTIKMAAFLTFPDEVAKLLQEAGVDGLTMFGGTFALDFDINGMRLPFRQTWCYFPEGASLPYTNRQIALARMAGVTTPISANFGVWDWPDVIKCIMSGADAVQVCRRIMLRGYHEATSWLGKINSWLDKNNYSSIAALKGAILEKLVMDYRGEIPREEPLERGGTPSLRVVLEEEKCAGCIDWCTRVCSYFALTPADKKVSVDETKCAGCGLCEGVCPFEALSLQPR